MKLIVWMIKKTELLSGFSIRLVYWTGKSKVPLHPKHLLNKNNSVWYRHLLNRKSLILDLGCGSGQHGLGIARYVKKVIGIDHDPENLRIASQDAKNRKIKNIEFKAGNLEEKIELKDRLADGAILFDVLEHIHKRQKFLKEVYRVLKDKGFVLVVIPNNDTSWKRLQRKYGISSFSDPDHKIEYTRKSIQKELAQAGFRIKSITVSSYDTPWVGFIDLIGGIYFPLYRKLSLWKGKMIRLHPEDSSGFQIVAEKS
jgi:ubiquinone/menaquinone biosynthesis C-methylase UbiE